MEDSLTLIDTVFIKTIDTLKINDTIFVGIINQKSYSSFFCDPSWIVAIAAIISAILSIIIYGKSSALAKRSLRNDINAGWVKLTDSRILFWKHIEAGYDIWKQEIGYNSLNENDRPSNDLSELVLNVGLPENIEKIKDYTTAEYILNEIRGVNGRPLQNRLLQFLSRIYPSEPNINSIILSTIKSHSPKSFLSFDKARMDLSLSYNSWAETTDIKYLKKRFYDDYCLIVLLSWIELCITEKLKHKWSNRPYLFKLARDIEKSRNR